MMISYRRRKKMEERERQDHKEREERKQKLEDEEMQRRWKHAEAMERLNVFPRFPPSA